MTPEEAIKVLKTLDLCGRNHSKIFLNYLDSEAINDAIEALQIISCTKNLQNIVKCKNCRYALKEDGYDNLKCKRLIEEFSAVEKDGFCAWGKI